MKKLECNKGKRERERDETRVAGGLVSRDR